MPDREGMTQDKEETKKRHCEYVKDWYKRNPEKRIASNVRQRKKKREWALNNKDALSKARIEWKARNPWYSSFDAAKARCTKKYLVEYPRYGGRGIQFKLSIEDVKDLWFRDKAFNMKRPSIDRIDNNGHYEKSNCRFIELRDNIRRRHGLI